MNQLWQTYKQLVKRNCIDPNLADTELAYWRNQMFAATVQFLIPLSVLALVPGMYMALITDFYLLLFADFIVIASFVFIAFGSVFTLEFKKKLLCASLYFVAVVLLYNLGSYGPGLLYLLALTVFITLIFELRYGVISLVLNTVICSLLGFFIYFKIGNSPIISEYNLDSWIAISANLIFLSAVMIVLIPRLFAGLQSAFDKRLAMERDLRKNKAELEDSLVLLEERSKELEQFAYVASHDLQEPLRMITSFLTQIERKYENVLDEKGKKYIFFATDGAKRMRQIILDLLEYSRLGRIDVSKQEVDLNIILEEVLALNQKLIQEKQASVSTVEMPVIHAIKPQMLQLFQNLIQNALNYQEMGNKPDVKIKVSEQDTKWVFSVGDNGIGIDSEYFDRIFIMFHRLHGKEAYPGTGMGLAVCKKIVEQHGGEIWVDSEEGNGSTFYFSIAKNQK